MINVEVCFKTIVDRGVLTSLFYEDPLYCLPPLFKILSNPLPSPFPVTSNPTPTALALVEWVIVPHLMCYLT